MKNLLKILFSFFKKDDLKTKIYRRKPKGQSLVEIALAFPVLIFLFSGMVEFGFMLNYYLSLLDATREAARFYSNYDPFAADPVPARNSADWFYIDTSDMVRTFLDPSLVRADYEGRSLILDNTMDDVIVTVYGKSDSGVISWPASGPWHLYNHATSAFSETSIENQMISGSPNAGILVVEVVYSYEQILGLPWTAFLGEHIMLRAHTVMPLNAAEPN